MLLEDLVTFGKLPHDVVPHGLDGLHLHRLPLHVVLDRSVSLAVVVPDGRVVGAHRQRFRPFTVLKVTNEGDRLFLQFLTHLVLPFSIWTTSKYEAYSASTARRFRIGGSTTFRPLRRESASGCPRSEAGTETPGRSRATEGQRG